MVFSSLPIEEIRGELMEALRVPSPRILLKAPTGSGKSTGVPPMMDDAGLGDRGLIVVVQPRRMAARLLARHVARLRGVEKKWGMRCVLNGTFPPAPVSRT